jgi:hypothetical protein
METKKEYVTKSLNLLEAFFKYGLEKKKLIFPKMLI